MSIHERLMAAGAECMWPKYIASVDGERVFVAESFDGDLRLTDAGRKFLADEPAEAPKPTKRVKKSEPVVESANALVDDLDLGD